MARHPEAIWDPIEKPDGGYWTNLPPLHAPDKIIHHRTQGDGYPRSTYVAGGGVPHFTVRGAQIYQHYDTNDASRALYNIAEQPASPNRDGTIQIEMVGFVASSEFHRQHIDTAETMAKLLEWIENVHGIPHVWPMGRPPWDGTINPASFDMWATQPGHYGHSQAVENKDSHHDPGYDDEEWEIINKRGTGITVATPIGRIDGVQDLGDGTLRVVGWALDPDTPSDPITVHIYVNGQIFGVVADRERTDVNDVMKVAGNHGVDTIVRPSIPVDISMYGIDSSGDAAQNAYLGGTKAVVSVTAPTGDALSEAQVVELVRQQLLSAKIALF